MPVEMDTAGLYPVSRVPDENRLEGGSGSAPALRVQGMRCDARDLSREQDTDSAFHPPRFTPRT
jgi:hypothetical protein